jgi:hypothetical protein
MIDEACGMHRGEEKYIQEFAGKREGKGRRIRLTYNV